MFSVRGNNPPSVQLPVDPLSPQASTYQPFLTCGGSCGASGAATWADETRSAIHIWRDTCLRYTSIRLAGARTSFQG